MLWDEFYNGHFDWADSTIRSRISLLEDIGPGSEILEVVEDIDDSKVRCALIRKAMKLGAEFTRDDYSWLELEIPWELFVELGAYAGFDPNDPEGYSTQSPEDDLPLDVLYHNILQLNEELAPKPKLRRHYFGAFLIALLGGRWRTSHYRRFGRKYRK